MTRFTMPLFVNEPLSMLQKGAEAFTYVSLLDEAAKEDNSLIRLGYVAAFSATRWNILINRT